MIKYMVIEVYPDEGVDVIVSGMNEYREAMEERSLWLKETDGSPNNVQVIQYQE